MSTHVLAQAHCIWWTYHCPILLLNELVVVSLISDQWLGLNPWPGFGPIPIVDPILSLSPLIHSL